MLKVKKNERQRTCPRCHLKKPDVKRRLNPFDREVHDKETYIVVCNDCKKDIARDI
jgi:nitrate/TMAO reductase-like tetraheme cytochrome c subunit